jgi:hypothetical protein
MSEELTAEQIAQAAAEKEAADKAAAELAATDPEALRKQIAILNSENAQRRLKEKELAEQLEKFNADKRAAEEKALAEKGEFKGLYETLKAENEGKDGKIQAYEGALNKLLESEMANIPEAMQALIPAGDISTKLEWIATAKAAKLFDPAKGPKVREPGEFADGTLEAKLKEATEAGNLSAVISLKKQIFDKKQVQ